MDFNGTIAKWPKYLIQWDLNEHYNVFIAYFLIRNLGSL